MYVFLTSCVYVLDRCNFLFLYYQSSPRCLLLHSQIEFNCKNISTVTFVSDSRLLCLDLSMPSAKWQRAVYLLRRLQNFWCVRFIFVNLFRGLVYKTQIYPMCTISWVLCEFWRSGLKRVCETEKSTTHTDH